MNLHARCTSGECALPFSALVPLLRARPCEYIVRNSTLRVLRERPEVCTEQCVKGEQVCRKLMGAAGGKECTL